MTMINKKLKVLKQLVNTNDNEKKDEIKKVIKEVVPTFREKGEE